MPTDYEQILGARTDLSPRLLHFTRDLKTLLAILEGGYLKPSFAERSSFRAEKPKKTILGPDPAVCFSEMPIAALKTLCGLNLKKQRYAPYGVSFDKGLLFRRRARPVVYGDEVIRSSLPDSLQYLWVGLDLNESDYATDWTHEREWRIPFRATDREYFQYDGVPLEFGHAVRPTSFQIICKSQSDAEAVRQAIGALDGSCSRPDSEPEWFAGYVARVQANLPIIHVLDDM